MPRRGRTSCDEVEDIQFEGSIIGDVRNIKHTSCHKHLRHELRKAPFKVDEGCVPLDRSGPRRGRFPKLEFGGDEKCITKQRVTRDFTLVITSGS